MIRENVPRAVLVTGAVRRIGAAIAHRLHSAGNNLILHGRSASSEIEALAARLNAARANSAAVLLADLQDLDALARLAQDAHARWGRLDGLVNNASHWEATPLGALSGLQFDQLVASNLRAPLFLSQACAPLLAEGGCIVNLLDVHARRPIAGFSAYLATKAGLWTLTEALALELAPRLRVNGVAPGLMSAEQTQFSAGQLAIEKARIPLARFGAPQDVAAAVCYLLSDEAAYLTGTVLTVDGGLHAG